MPALLADSELVLTCLVLLPWAGARCLHMPWEPCGVFLPDVMCALPWGLAACLCTVAPLYPASTRLVPHHVPAKWP